MCFRILELMNHGFGISRPILMAPKFGLEDVSVSNFDATLVLATMLVSQLHDRTTSTEPIHAAHGTEDQVQERPKGNVSEHPSDHTRIWSELSGKLFSILNSHRPVYHKIF